MERRQICADSGIWIDGLAGIDRALAAEVAGWISSNELLIDPALIRYEFTHVLTKHVRNRKMTPENAMALMRVILTLEINLVDDDVLHQRALELSIANPGLSGYDGHFVALCERTGSELGTADKRLAMFARANGISTRIWVT
jgi:predicted nucleic acid-binding protein